MKSKEAGFIFGRYFALLILGVYNLSIFYYLFTPATVYAVFSVAHLFDSGSVLLEGNIIFFKGFYAEIIPACVAGAAYYLLIILNLTTPMEKIKRIKSVFFLVFGFLLANIIRIVAFLFLWDKGFTYFDAAHKTIWYFGSTVLVVLIWFANVKLFGIKGIPIYDDVRKVIKDLKKGLFFSD